MSGKFNQSKHPQTEAIKKILDKAKIIPKDAEGDWTGEHHSFIWDVDDALFAIGIEKIYELKEELFPYLKDINPVFRITSIRALCYGFGKGLYLPEAKDIAYDMWLNDPDPEVKEVALREWIAYYIHSKNSEVLKYLYSIIYMHEQTICARQIALYGLIDVANAFLSREESNNVLDLDELAGDRSKIELGSNYTERYNALKMENLRLFNEAINQGYYYDKINSIMEKYVPDWKK